MEFLLCQYLNTLLYNISYRRFVYFFENYSFCNLIIPLSRKGIDCDCIAEGREALDSIRREKFDLILLDLAMPAFFLGHRFDKVSKKKKKGEY